MSDESEAGALADLRLAEARRMLGLETADDLGGRAAGWLAAGVSSPSVALLADGAQRSPEQALRLLRAGAVELDLTFATLQDARGHYVRSSLPDLTSPDGVGAIAGLSNGLTDEFTGRARRALGRLFGRGTRND